MVIVEQQRERSSPWLDLFMFCGITVSTVLYTRIKEQAEDALFFFQRAIIKCFSNTNHTSQSINDDKEDVVTEMKFPWEPAVENGQRTRSIMNRTQMSSSNNSHLQTTREQMEFISTMTFASNFQVPCPCCK